MEGPARQSYARQRGYSKREAWHVRKVKEGVQVVICHPKLVETGLDLVGLSHNYFLRVWTLSYTLLRQASRRSWRIGQHRPAA